MIIILSWSWFWEDTAQVKNKCYQLQLLFSCSKTIFCHSDNIGRPKLCDTIITIQYIELLPNPNVTTYLFTRIKIFIYNFKSTLMVYKHYISTFQAIWYTCYSIHCAVLYHHHNIIYLWSAIAWFRLLYA